MAYLQDQPSKATQHIIKNVNSKGIFYHKTDTPYLNIYDVKHSDLVQSFPVV